jgi:hypothetical protein
MEYWADASIKDIVICIMRQKSEKNGKETGDGEIFLADKL